LWRQRVATYDARDDAPTSIQWSVYRDFAKEWLMSCEIPPANGVPSAEETRRALERVLASKVFRTAESLSRILRFIVEHSIIGFNSAGYIHIDAEPIKLAMADRDT
jgi:hypothetical protein